MHFLLGGSVEENVVGDHGHYSDTQEDDHPSEIPEDAYGSDTPEDEDIEHDDGTDEDINNDEGQSSTELDADDMDAPIYSGHTMSIGTSMLLILLFTMAHNISGCQLNDLLTLIGCHCLSAHPGLKSLYNFKKYFAHLKSPIVKHYYCSTCYSRVGPDVHQCPNRLCQINFTFSKSKSYFLEIPIEHQLQNLFKRSGFVNLLGHRFSRKKKNMMNIEDIYDGSVYRNLSKAGGVLSTPYNLSLAGWSGS